ncbi:hypothetical protein BCR41DRAFT_33911 [Lobosporangium transversale]|uniref:Uncharacterized protein n=1 Tax=Lobosporangium transversale TaxID=64571 RepID=A0A1Y2GR65_9FUNG|nr:hypothetical protein BCR41DRAFT_33911 [Lobosporangium transversale]ORZ20025.1 hypothetical protein BCR41DRAFT_33911 [Lobosporangium transversale]|eukprot:XP_021882565.1 hypothetical protein BCR41DRAFT_33911 [Lobosporangium transversale]
MTGQSNLHLDAKLMASVHPYASSGTPIHSGGATVAKKEPLAKGIPIPVPTNQRRLSNFSVKTANRALMTGYRDGGGSSSRRKSSSFSQGFQPPPFYPHKDDFDVIGTVPGFEKLVEAEAQKHDKGKAKAVPNVTTLFDVDVQKEPKQNKRKKTGKERMEDDNPPSKLASSGPRGRRRS